MKTMSGSFLARWGILLLLAAVARCAAAAPARWERLAPLPVGNGGFVGAAIAGEIVVAVEKFTLRCPEAKQRVAAGNFEHARRV